jgi:alkylation response protein AidB-like acyl-CoA dehydrogenase
MDISHSPEAEAFRLDVRRFLEDRLPGDWEGIGALGEDETREFVSNWRETLRERGFLAPTWPVEYGGAGLTIVEHVVLAEELARAGVPSHGGSVDNVGIKMFGNTVLHWGTEEQKRYYLPRVLSGEDRWCQGYSEPGAGSDLANVATRAELRGDEWIINGQKIWTSHAHLANWIFLLVRTDPEATRKQAGISFLLCSMDQPGVEARSIEMLNATREFGEVFLDDARTPADHVVGPVNDGWKVANTLLAHERGADAAINPILFRAELDRLVELAKAYGRDRDPLVRDRLARCFGRVEIMRYLGYRILTTTLSGRAGGPEGSISKLYWSEYHREATSLALDILGPHALVPTGRRPARHYRADDPGSPNTTAAWDDLYLLNALSGTVYAGSSEIQRNILSESVLGLPREPRVEKSAAR